MVVVGGRPILMSCSRPSLTGPLAWNGLGWSGIGLDWSGTGLGTGLGPGLDNLVQERIKIGADLSFYLVR